MSHMGRGEPRRCADCLLWSAAWPPPQLTKDWMLNQGRSKRARVAPQLMDRDNRMTSSLSVEPQLQQEVREADDERPSARCSLTPRRGRTSATSPNRRLARASWADFSSLALCLLVIPSSGALTMLSSPLTAQIAVTGTTGRLGREAIQQLSAAGTPVRCLLRHSLDGIKPPTGISTGASSAEIAAYLATLPGVEMVQGDVTDRESVLRLLDGCSACLALHGATRRASITDALPWVNVEDTEPSHAKQVNYNGVKNIIEACQAEGATCKRIVRITGKGESPWQVFTVLINMLGSMAKGWNYEGEELLRQATPKIDYTIIRPGVMGPYEPKEKVFALADNGADLKVSPVRHADIATLAISCLKYPNAARSTLTAMNVPEGEGASSYDSLLADVTADTRDFPTTLIAEHKRAVAVVFSVLSSLALLLLGKLGLFVFSLFQ